MFNLKAWWAKLTEPYFQEKWEVYQEAVNVVCGRCSKPGLYCDDCPVMMERPRIKKELLGGKRIG